MDLAHGSIGSEEEGDKSNRRRFTDDQIERLEQIHDICPYPDRSQKLEISQELGLEPSQVKSWFKNKKTKEKRQLHSVSNIALRSENESVRNENANLMASLRYLVCPDCGLVIDDQLKQLKNENSLLRRQLDRLRSIIAANDTTEIATSDVPVAQQNQPSNLSGRTSGYLPGHQCVNASNHSSQIQ